jgi:hypothetical protein
MRVLRWQAFRIFTLLTVDVNAANYVQTLKVPLVVMNKVRCAFSDRIVHLRMPLDPTHVRLKRCHACDQWHSSRKVTAFIVAIINHAETLKVDRPSAEPNRVEDEILELFMNLDASDARCSRV